MRVDDVQRTSHGSHYHPNYNKHEEHIRGQPSVSTDVVGDESKPIEPDAAEYQLKDDQNDSEFGLKFSLVPFDHEAGGPVCKKTREDETEKRSDKGSRV
jgi:hypothetical protein